MVKFSGMILKRDELTIEEFKKYWVEVHAPIMLKVPGVLHYRLNVIDRKIDGAFPYDAFSEVWFESEEAMDAALASPEFAIVREDVQKFQKRTDRIMIDETIIIE